MGGLGGSGWPWLVRIYGGEQPIGAGFLIAERWVLTCAHVVNDALDREGGVDRPLIGITVDLPAVPASRYTARVLPGGWVPIDPDDETGDLAALVLDDELPAGVTPAPLRAVEDTEGVQFRAIGFPPGRVIGSAAVGEVRDRIGPGWQWAQLVSAPGPRVRKGYSGSPVWSQNHQAVIGLVISEDTGEADARGAAMLPLTVAAQLWPPLAKLIPTGILLDPSFASHWDPKARGVVRSKDRGDYFTGRRQALSELADWLSRPLPPGDVAGRLVTGSPGTGKSAVLSRLVVLADPMYRAQHPAIITAAPPSTLPPERSMDLAVHAAGLTLTEVTRSLAAAIGVMDNDPKEVVAAVVNRDEAFTLLVDALDEAAGGGEDIARELLRPLASQGRQAGIRVLVGGRPHLYDALGIGSNTVGDTFAALDLDLPVYLDPQDLTASIRAQLLLEQTPDQYTPYRGKPWLASRVADAVAARLLHPRANGAFLIGQIIAHALANTADPVDTNVPGWANRFATSIGGALNDRLAALGDSDARRARDFLRALAYSEAPIPQSTLWVTLANTLARRTTYSLDDLAWLLDGPASSWMIQSWQADGERVYTLYHQALSDHLRPDSEEVPRQRDITVALLTAIPMTKGYRDWSQAPRYVLEHLASHAASAGLLKELLNDAAYVLHANSGILRNAVVKAIGDERLKAAIDRTIVNRQRVSTLHSVGVPFSGEFVRRAERLQFNAREYGLDQLADDVERVVPARHWSVPWVHLWGDGHPLHEVEPHGCHMSNVHAAAPTSFNGVPAIVLSDFGGVQIRQLGDGSLRMRLGRHMYGSYSPRAGGGW